jgi:transposase-like protein
VQEKRRIVELTLQPGMRVARVAQVEGVNSHQVFQWRRAYRLQDVSSTSDVPELKVLIQPADRSSIVEASGPPKFVPAAQLEQSKQQLAALKSHVEHLLPPV